MTVPSLVHNVKPLLIRLLSAKYTEADLKTFIEYCYFMALPFVRRKIGMGKLNPGALGLKEGDIVYDCLADLFQRDREARILPLQYYFESLEHGLDELEDADVVIALRRLLFGAINKNIIRLYAEADPSLGKILRNLKIAVDRSDLVDQLAIFGEPHLIPKALDPLAGFPLSSIEELRQDFWRYCHSSDNIPGMLKSLYRMFLNTETRRRAVPLIGFAHLIREMYSREWAEERPLTPDETIDVDRVEAIIGEACLALQNEMYDQYVTSGKRSEKEYSGYLRAVRDILIRSLKDDHGSFHQQLSEYLPATTVEYLDRHRDVLEYLVKVARKKVAQQLDSDHFREAP